MSIPSILSGGLTLPAIVAPMFLVSGPDLVVECCNSGVIGTFPSLNLRTTSDYRDWVRDIKVRRVPGAAAFGVNHIVHASNPRLQADLEVTVEEKVPLVITSLGAVRDVIETVHGYGGLVFHDVANVHHARKAAESGVDGLILVANGAGGHAGTVNPFALLNEVREFFHGTLVLSGCISTGRDIAGTVMLGADLAYMGTRFIAATEASAPAAYKEMVIASAASDITYTPAVSGIPANFMTKSLVANGVDPRALPDHKLDMGEEALAWKTVWSSGQGCGSVKAVTPAADILDALRREYRQAAREFAERVRI